MVDMPKARTAVAVILTWGGITGISPHLLCYLAHFAGLVTRGTDAAMLTCLPARLVSRRQAHDTHNGYYGTARPMLGEDLQPPLPSSQCKRH